MTQNQEGAKDAAGSATTLLLEATGVPGLDEVLGGGIQRGSLAILAGPPGAGKTILAHHIAFLAARAGRRTTILTAFSEPTNKLIAHMRPFDFFDQNLLGQTLEVLSIQQFLRQGLDTVAEDILGTVRSTGARLVILDGFRSVRETAEHSEQARRFIYEISNRLSLLGITLLLTSEANARDAAFFPEATTADVLLGLAFDVIDARERRTLEVLKVRGAVPLNGQHVLAISDEGVTIYPRLEARMARLVGIKRPLSTFSVAATQAEEAISTRPAIDTVNEPEGAILVNTGIPGLDAQVGGGFVRGTSTLLVGERGMGKTLLGLQFTLQGVRSDESSLFVSFRETEEELVRKASPFAWSEELQRALDAGRLTVLRTPPIELVADVLVSNVFALLDDTHARRLVLDEVGEIENAFAALGVDGRFHHFMAAFMESLRLRGITSVFTRHLAALQRSALEHQLGRTGVLPRTLLWLRRTSYHSALHRLLILQTPSAETLASPQILTVRVPEGVSVLDTSDSTLVPQMKLRDDMDGMDAETAMQSNASGQFSSPD